MPDNRQDAVQPLEDRNPNGSAAQPPLIDAPATDAAETRALPFQVVGIGASAGGLEAYIELLKSLSPETGMAFVIISHLSAEHKSQLVPILSRHTSMQVSEIADGMRCEPNRVYILPPNARASIDQGHLKLEPRPARERVPRPIDYFFRSLAADQKNHAVGVILSGTDSDGALGLKAIKGEGGIAIVQSPGSARFPDMPLSGLGADHVDVVLPPGRIGTELARLAEQFSLPELKPLEQGEILQDEEQQFARILTMLRSVSGIDFRNYKPTTIRRRLVRRMMLKHIDSLPEYISHLQARPEELRELQEDVLINVTHLFRDPDVFEALKLQIFPRLLEGRSSGQPIRIWSAGCSSGEEAYSLAISLLESSAGLPVEPSVQIFGTDASEQSIERARAGVYPATIAGEISPERLRRFFVQLDHGYQISKRVRDLCIFARQNLCTDPPFSRLDLVSCRNVLIYLTPQIQNAIISMFHYSLKQDGFLLLGSSESLRDHSEMFLPIDRANKFYAKASGARHVPLPPVFPVQAGGHTAEPPPAPSLGETWTESELQRAADRIVLARHGPPGVVVNGKMEVLQVRGQVGPYLQIAPGTPTLHLSRMAREEIAPALRGALQRAIAEDIPARAESVRAGNGENAQEIAIEVLPVQSIPARPRCYLVLFLASPLPERKLREEEPPEWEPGSATVRDQATEMAQLRQDLSSSRLYLQSLIEERDVRNQEVTSAYEEVQSANEELQSANEELETAKEELQSTNEELQTVNEELRTRNNALVQASNDLANLFTSVNIPIVMLGIDLTIRHFTPSTERLMRLRAADIGRPIGEVRLNLKLETIEPLLHEVLDTLTTRELEVEDLDGCWHLLRVRPYRTAENKIEGVVLVLFDISQFRRGEQAMRDARDFAQRVVESVPVALAILDEEFRIEKANAAFRSFFGIHSLALENVSFPDLANRVWNLGQLAPKLEDVRRGGVEELDFEHWTAGAGGKTIRFKALPVQLESRQFLLVMLDDITSQKEAERMGEDERKHLAGEVKTTTRELGLAHDRMRILAANLLTSHEDESRRLARDLHDDVGQKLAVLQIEIQRLLDKTPAEPQELKRRMQGLVERTFSISTEVRTLSHQLHPAIIEDLGLAVALEELVKEFGGSEDMPATFAAKGLPPNIPIEVSTSLYRIAQEALRNVAKHAGKTHVRVNLTGRGGSILLSIRDLGAGFDLSQERTGLGLVSMEERARLVGGAFRVESQVNGGTSVEIEVPLTSESGARAN